jgi:hypothetical protein
MPRHTGKETEELVTSKRGDRRGPSTRPPILVVEDYEANRILVQPQRIEA